MTDPNLNQQALSNSGIAINNAGEFIIHGDITQTNHIYQLPHPPTAVEMAQIVAKANEHLATIPLQAIPAPADLPAESRLPYRPNPSFIGREDELRQLARTTRDEQHIVITGLGGVGKSQVALAFAHRYGQYFAGGVYWLSLADPHSVANEVIACGGAHVHPRFFELDTPDQVHLVRQSWQEPLPRLLIFDHCESETLLNEWLPTTGGSRIIVTSRRGAWSPELGLTMLPLPSLPRPQSIALLRRLAPRLAEGTWQAELDELAAELGDFPLALNLAGSYLEKYGTQLTPPALTTQLRDEGLHGRVLNQHARNSISPTGHDWAVVRTFELSFEQLQTPPLQPEDEVALALLARAACFAPGEPIPQALLFATGQVAVVPPPAPPSDNGLLARLRRLAQPEDEPEPSQVWSTMALIDGLERLLGLGLLVRVADDAVEIHRLLARYVPDAVGAEAWRVAHTAVGTALVQQADELNSTNDPRGLRPWRGHLQYVTEHTITLPESQALGASLANALGFHLLQVGDLDGAHHWFTQGLTVRQDVLAEDDPYTAVSLNNVGLALKKRGEYDAARAYYEQALAIRRKIHGEQHPDTAQSLNVLGVLLQEQGQFALAEEYLTQSLAIRQATLGETHPDTATTLNNLGVLYEVQGDYAQARPYFEASLDIWRNIYGESHPRMALVLGNLGQVYQGLGEMTEAEELYQLALAMNREVFGEQHPEVIWSWQVLGEFYLDVQDYAAAQPCFEELSDLQLATVGAEHPDTATAWHNLGFVHKQLGNLAEARALYEQALEVRLALLGEAHIDTAYTLNNLGMLHYAEGDLTTAVALIERSLATREALFGREHPITQRAQENLDVLRDELADSE